MVHTLVRGLISVPGGLRKRTRRHNVNVGGVFGYFSQDCLHNTFISPPLPLVETPVRPLPREADGLGCSNSGFRTLDMLGQHPGFSTG
jgi:hypothetical protein